MELLLNVIWLLLAVPAIWLWHEGDSGRPRTRRFRALGCPLILGFTLALLFPVVSVTDDLHAMRPEVEELGFSKRIVKPVAIGKSPASMGGNAPIFGNCASGPPFCLNDQTCGTVVLRPESLIWRISFGLATGRAPPLFRLT